MQFTVEGEPVPWARAKRSGKRFYTGDEQAAYKDKVVLCAKAARLPKLKGPVAMTVRAWFKCRGDDERVRVPYPGGPKDTKPDVDNCALKLFMDALEGIAYANDSQVAEAHIYKRWAPQGERGRVVVTVAPIKG